MQLLFLVFLAVAQAQYMPISYRLPSYRSWEYPLVYKTALTTPLVETRYDFQTPQREAHSFGYSSDLHARAENRDIHGNIQGSYSYLSPDGRLIQRNYRANAVEGFKQDEKRFVPEIRTDVVQVPVVQYPWVGSALKATSYKAYRQELNRKKRDTLVAYRDLAVPDSTSTVNINTPTHSHYQQQVKYEPKMFSYKTIEQPKVLSSYKMIEQPKMVYKTIEQPKMVYKTIEQPKMVYKTIEQPKMVYKTIEQPQMLSYKAIEQPQMLSYKAIEQPLTSWSYPNMYDNYRALNWYNPLTYNTPAMYYL